MDTRLVGELIRLRYKLMWAKTRSRNGRIAMFLTGYLLLIVVVSLLATGGFGAALMAVRNGKGELVAQAVLGAIFLEAVFASNLLGFGLNAIFSDGELRRYPLSAVSRAVARHLIGLADPFWLLFFALELGLAVGLYVAGAGFFWLGLIAVLLLFVCNYLLARLVGVIIDRLMQRRTGSALLLAFVMLLAIGPSLMMPVFRKNPELQEVVLGWLRYTPPFGAAAAMIHSGAAAVNGLLLIVIWSAVLAAMLTAVERRPLAREAKASVKIDWDSRYEKVAAMFPPHLAPLIAHWLRFYLRNNRTRAMAFLALPLVAFLTYQNGRRMGPDGFFVAAMGAFPVATFMGVARISVNQFGYSGGGFRRYFLLPTEPAAALRAGSYTSLLIGGASIPVLLAAWLALAPGRFDAGRLVMLTASSIAGLLLFHAGGLWVTLFNARKGNYQSSMGNDLSLGGNILVIGGVLTALFGPILLHKVWPAPFRPANWWSTVMVAALAVGIYWFSLKTTADLFGARRERLLAIVEGRD